jgi:hypothetical protein
MLHRTWFLLLLTLPKAAECALVDELGELQVNSHTSLAQSQAAVAAAPDGRFVVVWQSATSPGDDSSDLSIQAQRFDATGAPVGAQFQVNTFTPSTQSLPDVAMNAEGDFVVVWQSFGAPLGGDGALEGVRARGFDADGVETFAEIQVNDRTSGAQTRPSVAWVADDELVVVWDTSATLAPDGDGSASSIQARRFDASGAPLASQFLVNVTTSGFQNQPEISADGGGGFAVVWASDDDPGGAALFRLRARTYGPGAAAGSEILVDDTLLDQGAPAIDHGEAGFVVAWQSLAADGSGRGIRARRYTMSGTPLAAAFTVNDVVNNDQIVPSVGVLPTGDFVVAWQSESAPPGGDASARSVQARLFDSSGNAPALQFQVNVYALSSQDAPSLAVADLSGRLIAAWESNGSFGSDTSLLSIQARTWRDGRLLFRDDFETGDACRWSPESAGTSC